MKNLIQGILLLVAVTMSACGSGNGYTPVQLTGNPASTPDMTLPLSTSGFSSLGFAPSLFTGYNSTTLGFQWTVSAWNGTQVAAYAPMAGLVTLIETGQANNTTNVTIYFNSRYSVKVSGLAGVNSVRMGDYVTKGQQIGLVGFAASVTAIAPLKLSLFLDGNSICPFSYFDQATRSAITTQSWYSTTLGVLCQ